MLRHGNLVPGQIGPDKPATTTSGTCLDIEGVELADSSGGSLGTEECPDLHGAHTLAECCPAGTAGPHCTGAQRCLHCVDLVD